MAGSQQPLAHDEKSDDAAEVCDCPCHAPGSAIVHVIPCCRICPHCRRRIKYTMFEAHLARHQRAKKPA